MEENRDSHACESLLAARSERRKPLRFQRIRLRCVACGVDIRGIVGGGRLDLTTSLILSYKPPASPGDPSPKLLKTF